MEEERTKLKVKKEKKSKNGAESVCLDSSRVSGAKHGLDEEGENALLPPSMAGKEANLNGGNGKNLNSSSVDGMKAAKASAKRFKAVDMAPPNATKEVYASIFTSSKKSEFKETYMCRSLPLGRN